MKRPKYPKYTKEIDGRCKLTEKDIATIQVMKKNGETNKAIAEHFGVSDTLVRYWTIPSLREKTINYQKKRIKENPPSKEERREIRKRYNEKKNTFKEYLSYKIQERRYRRKASMTS